MAKRIIVIGGGLSGAAAAYRLRQLGYDVTIIEKNDRLGGRIHSHLVQGAAVEMGAAFITKSYTNLWNFLEQTRMSDRPQQRHSQLGIYRNGKVHITTAHTLFGNEALSFGAKLQAFPLLIRTLTAWPRLDPHAFWKAAAFDERPVTDMLSGANGKEFMEYVLQPVINGYFYWPPEHTSEAMMLILAKALFFQHTYRLAGGLQQIPEKLAEGSAVLLEHAVQTVTYTRGEYQVHVAHGNESKTLTADGIVCATTASVVPKIFPELSQSQKDFFDSIAYSSGTLISRTYAAEQTRGDKAIAFPRKEGIELSSVTLSPEIMPDGRTLATATTYASGSSAKKLGKLSDDALIKTLADMMEPARTSVLTDDAEPIATQVQRWDEALPFYDVGHFKRLQAFARGEIEDKSQPLVFAGDYIGGPFMEGAFTSGLNAADRLHLKVTI